MISSIYYINEINRLGDTMKRYKTSMKEKIAGKNYGVLTYGITPPKINNDDAKIKAIANRQIERIKQLDIDGLIIYDIQDESARTNEKRTFDFIHTVDPSDYSKNYLSALDVPRIVYRCVGNYDKEAFETWVKESNEAYSVFVGAASRKQTVTMSLSDAYDIHKNMECKFLLGGVVIPERHIKCLNEPERLAHKVKKGCEYFVSQAVYDLDVAKQFLRDYVHYFTEHNMDIKPIIFTLTPCGSKRTLQFINWLGIRVPNGLEDELLSADNMLEHSLTLVTNIFKELTIFSKELGVPIGCNVESVSIRKEEIEASIQLAKDIRRFMNNV